MPYNPCFCPCARASCSAFREHVYDVTMTCFIVCGVYGRAFTLVYFVVGPSHSSVSSRRQTDYPMFVLAVCLAAGRHRYQSGPRDRLPSATTRLSISRSSCLDPISCYSLFLSGEEAPRLGDLVRAVFELVQRSNAASARTRLAFCSTEIDFFLVRWPACC